MHWHVSMKLPCVRVTACYQSTQCADSARLLHLQHVVFPACCGVDCADAPEWRAARQHLHGTHAQHIGNSTRCRCRTAHCPRSSYNCTTHAVLLVTSEFVSAQHAVPSSSKPSGPAFTGLLSYSHFTSSGGEASEMSEPSLLLASAAAQTAQTNNHRPRRSFVESTIDTRTREDD